MAGGPVIERELLHNGLIKEDSVKRLLNVQFQCRLSEQGRGCG